MHLIVCGIRHTGKSSIISALAPMFKEDGVDFEEAPAFGTDRDTNAEIVATFSDADGVIVVLDQDLRDYEFDVIKHLAALHPRERLVLVLNKTDWLTPSARQETLSAINRRVRGLLPSVDIIEAQASPRPAIRVVTTSDGIEREVEINREPSIAALGQRIQCMKDMR